MCAGKETHYTPGKGFSPQFAVTNGRLDSAPARRREESPALPPRLALPQIVYDPSGPGDGKPSPYSRRNAASFRAEGRFFDAKMSSF
jgi:hypothetical protein